MNIQFKLYGVTHPLVDNVGRIIRQMKRTSQIEGLSQEYKNYVNSSMKRLWMYLTMNCSKMSEDTQEYMDIHNLMIELGALQGDLKKLWVDLQRVMMDLIGLGELPMMSAFKKIFENENCAVLVKTKRLKASVSEQLLIQKVMMKKDWKQMDDGRGDMPHVFFGNPAMMLSDCEFFRGQKFFEYYADFFFTPKSSKNVIFMYGDVSRCNIPEFSLPWNTVSGVSSLWEKENIKLEYNVDNDLEVQFDESIDEVANNELDGDWDKDILELLSAERLQNNNYDDFDVNAPPQESDRCIFRENGGSWYPDLIFSFESEDEEYEVQLRSYFTVVNEDGSSERIHYKELEEGDCVIIPGIANKNRGEVPQGMRLFNQRLSEKIQEWGEDKLLNKLSIHTKKLGYVISKDSLKNSIRGMMKNPFSRPRLKFQRKIYADVLGLSEEELKIDLRAYKKYRGARVNDGTKNADNIDAQLSSAENYRDCCENGPVKIEENGSCRILGCIKLWRMKLRTED